MLAPRLGAGQRQPDEGDLLRQRRPGKGAAALGNAIRNGCAKGLVENNQADSCSPAPAACGRPLGLRPDRAGQQVLDSPKASRTASRALPNIWVTAASPAHRSGDQRFAYIIPDGRTAHVRPPTNNDWLPIDGLLKVYVTGWDRQGGGGGPATCATTTPRRGATTAHGGPDLGAHSSSPITLDPP